MVGSPPHGVDEKRKLIVINGTETSPYLVTFIKSFLKLLTFLLLHESHATVCFAGAFRAHGNSWQPASRTSTSVVYRNGDRKFWKFWKFQSSAVQNRQQTVFTPLILLQSSPSFTPDHFCSYLTASTSKSLSGGSAK